jgi:hypothetical protein
VPLLPADNMQQATVALEAARQEGLLSVPFAPAQTSCRRTAVTTADGDYDFAWTLTMPPGVLPAASADGGNAIGAHRNGNDNGSRRQLVVLLHGFLGAPADWAPIAQVRCGARHLRFCATSCMSSASVSLPPLQPSPRNLPYGMAMLLYIAGPGGGRGDVRRRWAAGVQRHRSTVSTRT